MNGEELNQQKECWDKGNKKVDMAKECRRKYTDRIPFVKIGDHCERHKWIELILSIKIKSIKILMKNHCQMYSWYNF